MDSDNQIAMNLGETYLVTSDGNERLGKKKNRFSYWLKSILLVNLSV